VHGIRIRSLVALLVCGALSGCFIRPYKMDIQQGNSLDQGQLAKLKPGMTHSQVRFIMGTPLVADPFHPDRWDYLYIDRKKGRLVEYRRLTLYFDGDKLRRALTDLPAAPEGPAAAPAQKPATAPAQKPAATAAAR
jgi:outer membrane protein assembly factor BamE